MCEELKCDFQIHSLKSKSPLPHSVPVYGLIVFRGIILRELFWRGSNPKKVEHVPNGQVTQKHRGNTWKQEV